MKSVAELPLAVAVHDPAFSAQNTSTFHLLPGHLVTKDFSFKKATPFTALFMSHIWEFDMISNINRYKPDIFSEHESL